MITMENKIRQIRCVCPDCKLARKELLDDIIAFFESQNYIMEGKGAIIKDLKQFYERR